MYDVQGAGNVGQPGSDARVVGAKTVQKFIDIVVKHGQYGVDTSNIYAGGTSEQVTPVMRLLAVLGALTFFFFHCSR